MSLYWWWVIWLVGAALTCLAFSVVLKQREQPLNHPWFFWPIMALLWPAVWVAVVIAYIVDGREEL